MSTTKEIGDFYEDKAKDFYLKNGYTFLAENYRYGRREIDLIFKKENILVFVEVKYRNSSSFGYPEDWVDERKQLLIEECADYFIEEINWHDNIRFDIIAFLKKGNGIELKVFTDVF